MRQIQENQGGHDRQVAHRRGFLLAPALKGKTKSDNRKMNSERLPRSAQISMRLTRSQLAELDRAAARSALLVFS